MFLKYQIEVNISPQSFESCVSVDACNNHLFKVYGSKEPLSVQF